MIIHEWLKQTIAQDDSKDFISQTWTALTRVREITGCDEVKAIHYLANEDRLVLSFTYFSVALVGLVTGREKIALLAQGEDPKDAYLIDHAAFLGADLLNGFSMLGHYAYEFAVRFENSVGKGNEQALARINERGMFDAIGTRESDCETSE